MLRLTQVCLILALFLLPANDVSAQGDQPLRIICFGAHPDDAEYKSGGTAALWAKMGHKVKLVSVTNGIRNWCVRIGITPDGPIACCR